MYDYCFSFYSQQDLDSLASQVRGAGHIQPNETGHYSDATASAAGSDDEGSTAATDGSTLRTSPAEQVSKSVISLVPI